jgi:hypothetical protein
VRRSDVWLHDCGSTYQRTQALKLAGLVMPTKQPTQTDLKSARQILLGWASLLTSGY